MTEVVPEPGALIGYRKSGKPIYLMAGGAPDDPEPAVSQLPPPVDPDNIFSNDVVKAAIEKVRREEKDKLYPRIDKQADQLKTLEAELAVLRQEREERLALEAQKAAELTSKAEAKRKEEVSAKTLLEEKTAEFEARFAALAQEREQEKALLAKEREFLALQSYTQAAVAAAADDIDPRFLDYITGNTQEEVDASISRAKAKTQELFEELQQVQLQARQSQRGVSAAGYSTTGPMDMEPLSETVTAEQLRAMPMSKYAEFRGKLGIGGDSRGSNRGLFG